MRKCLVFLLLLAGCHAAPLSYDQQIMMECKKSGYADKELDDCYSAGIKAYNQAQQRWAKEYKKQAAAADKAKKSADTSQCRGFGYKTGTNEFAYCMQKLSQDRMAMAQQQALANQQIEANRQAAFWQSFTNYQMQQQAIQQQQNHMVHCTTTQTGVFQNTNCY